MTIKSIYEHLLKYGCPKDDDAGRVECTPDGYKFHDWPSPDRDAGGVALVVRTGLTTNKVASGAKTSFEFGEYIVRLNNTRLKVAILYRPPYSKENHVPVSTFLREVSEYLSGDYCDVQRTPFDNWRF